MLPDVSPISDLKNYSDVLRNVSAGAPVFVAKNRRGCYAMMVKMLRRANFISYEEKIMI